MSEQSQIDAMKVMIEAFNDNNWQGVRAPLAANSVYNEVGTQRVIEGADGVVQAWQGWKQAFPDVKGRVNSAIASGNVVALEVTWEGTHTGPMMTPNGEIPPTGKRQTTNAAWIVSFDGDKVRESHMYFDMMTMMQQLGLMSQ